VETIAQLGFYSLDWGIFKVNIKSPSAVGVAKGLLMVKHEVSSCGIARHAAGQLSIHCWHTNFINLPWHHEKAKTIQIALYPFSYL
jgi:hypothetical protein